MGSFDGPNGYREYMNSDEWRARRARYFERRAKRCKGCRFYTPKMNLHHKTYEHLGDEPDRDLVPLCPVCHDLVHQIHDLTPSWSLDQATDRTIERIKTQGRPQVVHAMKDRRRKKARPRPLYGLLELAAFQPEEMKRKPPMPVVTGPSVTIAGTSGAKLPK